MTSSNASNPSSSPNPAFFSPRSPGTPCPRAPAAPPELDELGGVASVSVAGRSPAGGDSASPTSVIQPATRSPMPPRAPPPNLGIACEDPRLGAPVAAPALGIARRVVVGGELGVRGEARVARLGAFVAPHDAYMSKPTNPHFKPS